jgi:predicted transcriptional regulator
MPIAYQINTVTRINSTAKDLFIYLFDLSPLEMNLLFLLIKTKKPLTLEQLSQKINRDKSTVFRALQKLVRLEICLKDAKMIKEGGYYHVYTATDTQTLKIETEKRVKEIKESFDRLLRRFEADMNKAAAAAIATSYDNNNNQTQ